MNTSSLKPKRSFPTHVQTVLSRGELWRAKEILQGTIATSQYDPLLYEQYGLILFQMDDLMEAGKYLFLSGQVKEEYEAAINLYLKRFGGRDWQTLAASFPRRAKNIKFELFPEPVRMKLRALQMPANYGQEIPAHHARSARHKFFDTLALIGCVCVGILIFVCFVTGFIVLFQEMLKLR